MSENQHFPVFSVTFRDCPHIGIVWFAGAKAFIESDDTLRKRVELRLIGNVLLCSYGFKKTGYHEMHEVCEFEVVGSRFIYSDFFRVMLSLTRFAIKVV